MCIFFLQNYLEVSVHGYVKLVESRYAVVMVLYTLQNAKCGRKLLAEKVKYLKLIVITITHT